MAQNITLLGASYSNVPAVDLPKTGGGTASFTDVTDTTAAAADVAQGKYFYLANGTRTEGTASGGGGSGSVWQDGQGFVNLDDQPGTHVQVDALNVTTNGTYTAPTGHAYSPVTVSVSGGGGSVEEKQINFYDYDGTLVDSYSSAEWANVSTLPSNPSHTGLTAQGWNWTKTQIDNQLTAAPGGVVNVGQNYVTTSGATEIDLDLTKSVGRLNPGLSVAVNGTVSVDWGDGSTPDTVTGTSLTTRTAATHQYSATGKYTIKISATSGTYALYCTTSYPLLYNTTTTGTNQASLYLNRITEVRCGSDMTIGQYAFYSCRQIKAVALSRSITYIGANAFENAANIKFLAIPDTAATLGNYAFRYMSSLKCISIPVTTTSVGQNPLNQSYSMTSMTLPYSNPWTSSSGYMCHQALKLESVVFPTGTTAIPQYACYGAISLTDVVIPSGVTSINSYAFYGCNTLPSITLPDTLTSIGGNAFYNAFALTSITIPANVTSIGASAFQYCYGMKEYHFKSVNPPTLANANAFSSIPSDCVIYVPSASLTDYQTASIWSTYASQMQGE